jgi:hypothetical protein
MSLVSGLRNAYARSLQRWTKGLKLFVFSSIVCVIGAGCTSYPNGLGRNIFCEGRLFNRLNSFHYNPHLMVIVWDHGFGRAHDKFGDTEAVLRQHS